jgi:hypothetical protein
MLSTIASRVNNIIGRVAMVDHCTMHAILPFEDIGPVHARTIIADILMAGWDVNPARHWNIHWVHLANSSRISGAEQLGGGQCKFTVPCGICIVLFR